MPPLATPPGVQKQDMYIERIVLKNIRCFAELDVRLHLGAETLPWTLVLGDNASGKTALLRSIAMGLCDESSAAGLMKEAEAGYIRRGSSSGKIVIELRRRPGGRAKYRIETTVEKVPSRRGTWERIRQQTRPAKSFPWSEIFVSAYGAGRGTAGTGDTSGYSPINGVYNLFNYEEGLQNPELMMYRTNVPFARDVKRTINDLLETTRIGVSSSGVALDGPWGRQMPLRDLADGYKSTFLWISDLLGWAYSFTPKLRSSRDVRGVVIIDEIEQHLHATWQRRIVQSLRRVFPHVQFFASTHSPLIASSVGGSLNEADRLILLELDPEKKRVDVLDSPDMRGWRVDQVLASRAFKYLVDADPDVEEVLRTASQLAGKGSSRTPSEERRFLALKRRIAELDFLEGTTLVQREIEEESLQRLRDLIKKLEKLHGSEAS